MKKFCVAKSGPTSDGRVIKPEWLTDIAETYDPNKYTARIFVEHIRGATADSAFFCGGDVVAVEANKNDAGEMCLYAQIAPNDKFKAMNKADQKVFPSIEVVENFAGTGKAYLGGLGATDSPASLGTEKFKFSATSPFATGVTGRGPAYIGEAIEISTIFATDESQTDGTQTASEGSDLEGVFTSVFKKIFAKFGFAVDGGEVNTHTQQTQAQTFTANDLNVASKDFANSVLAHLAKQGYASTAEVQALRDELANAQAQASTNHTARPPAAGGNGDSDTSHKANY